MVNCWPSRYNAGLGLFRSGNPAMPDGTKFRELIRRVRDRDSSAAHELATQYESAIRRVVRIHLRDARLRRVLDSMDVCQSVLASFFVRTALGQYELETPEQLVSLLTVITRNKLRNQVSRERAMRRDNRRAVPLDTEGVVIVDRASEPSEQASARELLAKVCERLDVSERYLAEQRSLGRTWPELAQELGGTDVALRKRFGRALNRVLSELGLDEDQDV